MQLSADGKVVPTVIGYDWLYLELTVHIRIAMEGIRVLVADGKVVSIGITFDLVYIELTFHTHSDVNYKNICS